VAAGSAGILPGKINQADYQMVGETMTCDNWWFLAGVFVSGVILFGLLWLAWRLISYWGGRR